MIAAAARRLGGLRTSRTGPLARTGPSVATAAAARGVFDQRKNNDADPMATRPARFEMLAGLPAARPRGPSRPPRQRRRNRRKPPPKPAEDSGRAMERGKFRAFVQSIRREDGDAGKIELLKTHGLQNWITSAMDGVLIADT